MLNYCNIAPRPRKARQYDGIRLFILFLCLTTFAKRHPPVASGLSPPPSSRPRAAIHRVLTETIPGALSASSIAPANIVRSVSRGYDRRVAADPSFPQKSVAEVALAVGTQLAAEFNRRGGPAGVIREIDFVVAAVLTAIAGKYYSMWRVAPTVEADGVEVKGDVAVSGTGRWLDSVPNNAFQPYLLDGSTRPAPSRRIAALFVPMPALFQAGFIASAIGYGLTALLIKLRSILMPGYIPATAGMNLLKACLYTGSYVATSSNMRYQVLQGIVEPRIVDRLLGKVPPLRAAVTFLIRLCNNLLGSMLAIMGMRFLGLQRMQD